MSDDLSLEAGNRSNIFLVRLTDGELAALKTLSERLCVTPSAFVRMLLRAAANAKPPTEEP